MKQPIVYGTLKPAPKPNIKLFYNEQDGQLVSASATVLPEFQNVPFKEVSWDEGKDFLTGAKILDQYFVNLESKRQEVVKKNIIQSVGHDHNFHLVDVMDYATTDISKANLIIEISKNSASIRNDTNIRYTITKYKNPMAILNDFSKVKDLKLSVYVHMDDHKKVIPCVIEKEN